MSNQKRWIASCASIRNNSEPTARSCCFSLGIRFDSPTEQKLKESRMTMDDNRVFETKVSVLEVGCIGGSHGVPCSDFCWD